LLDAMMPGMDGFALAEQIKCRPELAGAVLLMLSSAARPEDADRCRQLGIATYLVKPINQLELLDAILTIGHGPTNQSEASVSRATTAADRRLRILLAEDNLVNQRLATRILQKRGHEVVVAANGSEALAALERGVFDVVLMDVQMPELGGFEATAAIRKKEALEGLHRRIPIIAITAYAMSGDRERCLEAGMDHYIAKPIRAEELIDAVNRVITCEGIGEGHAAYPRASDQEVDVVELNRNVGDDPGLRTEITATFLDTYAEMLDELRQAIDRHDPAAVQRTAHNFKGAVGIFGASKVFDGASGLESMARRQDLSQAKETYGALIQAMERLKPLLVRLLDDDKGCLST
jgi:CheY-like chemotaxis protein